MEERSIETSHGSIAYYDSRSDGLPVVMLHANSTCKESFSPQIAALSETYRTIALDLPGHGHSSDATDPRRTYHVRGYADVVTELLTSLEVERVALLGHSLGGHVALELMARTEGPIVGVAIFGAPPIASSIEGLMAGFVPGPDMDYTGSPTLSEQQVRMIARLALGAEDEGDDFFIDAIRRTDGRARQYMMKDAFAGNGHDQRRVVETSAVPLLIVNGMDDPVINLDYVDQLSYRALATAQPIRLTGAAHAPNRESPEDFNASLIDFLQKVATGQ